MFIDYFENVLSRCHNVVSLSPHYACVCVCVCVCGAMAKVNKKSYGLKKGDNIGMVSVLI